MANSEKTQVIRSDVPTWIHRDVKKWAYENKELGLDMNTEKKVYAELIRLGHRVYADLKKKSK
ncbi:hypothetical protein ES703_70204 [subsurface metagenome]